MWVSQPKKKHTVRNWNLTTILDFYLRLGWYSRPSRWKAKNIDENKRTYQAFKNKLQDLQSFKILIPFPVKPFTSLWQPQFTKSTLSRTPRKRRSCKNLGRKKTSCTFTKMKSMTHKYNLGCVMRKGHRRHDMWFRVICIWNHLLKMAAVIGFSFKEQFLRFVSIVISEIGRASCRERV